MKATLPPWIVAVAAVATSCSSPHGQQQPRWPGSESRRAPAYRPSPAFEQQGETAVLHANWDELGLFAFERWTLEAFPEDRVQGFDDESLALLGEALGGHDERAVRAAVLLARSADERAAEALMTRLETRSLGPARDSDAADIVAAAGLGATPAGRAHAERLVQLAVGAAPHPDLEVRVECAAAALGAGRTQVVPFLVRVLRELTPAGSPETRDWEPQTNMAWSKSRAAEALSRAAGVELRFSPDASVSDQMAAAEELERLLADR